MMTETAVVVRYETGKATVKCQTKSACGSCAARNACGTAALAGLTGEQDEHLFSVETLTPVKQGQLVEIGLPERSLIASAFWLYAVPLLTLIITTFATEIWLSDELIRAVFIFFLTALSFAAVKFFTRKIQKKPAFQPVLLRIIG
ncbi:SoxR reducing system RseC family protein [Exercitatus varius]|uniref:SoxR reducing system RseC family protein n=1 Tax=Exercitatus varius TaxID=67857 RepID=UPI00294AE738|nr:SoxR reducing system RseC family protein [Exercitatus varius]MDG2952659.1 SoxR reducing system RseC family protein [Exercitatus varius]